MIEGLKYAWAAGGESRVGLQILHAHFLSIYLSFYAVCLGKANIHHDRVAFVRKKPP